MKRYCLGRFYYLMGRVIQVLGNYTHIQYTALGPEQITPPELACD